MTAAVGAAKPNIGTLNGCVGRDYPLNTIPSQAWHVLDFSACNLSPWVYPGRHLETDCLAIPDWMVCGVTSPSSPQDPEQIHSTEQGIKIPWLMINPVGSRPTRAMIRA